LTADGTAYFSAETVEMMRHLMQNDAHCDSLETLTSREREVAQLIAEGYTNKQIAAKLGMSVRTADTHRTNIMSKLDLANVAALTRWAIAKNLVDPGFGFFAHN
jgi:DNA-binding NarL/FixJ family response regulator